MVITGTSQFKTAIENISILIKHKPLQNADVKPQCRSTNVPIDKNSTIHCHISAFLRNCKRPERLLAFCYAEIFP